ncbi:MAG: hypothetical protein H6826_15600 [Planctomycetes bacterium]|nr:hypothetical protein [Planctomycetota bacterium]
MGSRLPRFLRRKVVADAVRAVRIPRWELDVWRDRREAQRDWAAVPGTCTGAPNLLLFAWRDSVFEAKVFTLMARAAGTAGIPACAVVRDWRHTRTRRLFRAVGLPASVAPEVDLDLSPSDLACLERGTYDEVAAWCPGDVPLGRLVLSSAIRELRDTSPDRVLSERDRLVRLGREALNNLESARILLDRHPSVTRIGLAEPGYVHAGPLFRLALARKLQVIYPTLSFRDDALLFKRYVDDLPQTDLPLTVDRASFERASQEPWTETSDREVEAAFQDRYGGRWEMTRTFQTTTTSCGDTPLHPRRREGRPLAVIFCHVLWDATFWAGEDLFADYAEWLEQTVRAAMSIEDVDWIVKAHPANAFRSAHGDVRGCAEVRLLEEKLPPLPPHIHVMLPDAPVTALDCFAGADVGITVRGMPGVEMACFGKRVLTAGTGPFDRLGFTDDFDTQQAYLDALSALGTAGPVPEERAFLARRYALTLFRERPFVLTSYRLHLGFTQGDEYHPLDRNLHPVLGANHADTRALGRWLVGSRDRDWITAWHANEGLPKAP